MSVVFTVVLLLIAVLGITLYRIGAVARVMGCYVLGCWAASMLLMSAVLVAFSLPPYPWIAYHVLHMRVALLSLNAQQSTQWCQLCLYAAWWLPPVVCVVALVWKRLGRNTTFGDAHFMSAWEMQRAGLFGDAGVILGKSHGRTVRSPSHEGVLVVAPTGGGKTRSLAMPNCLDWPGSIVVNDLKGELYQYTAKHRQDVLGNHCIRLAFSDPGHNTDCYNPFELISDDPKLRIRDLQLIAETWIPSERVDGGFWYTSSREVFLMLALYFLEAEGQVTLAKIHDASKREDFFEWLEYVVESDTVKSSVFYQNAWSLLNSDQDKTRKNILKDFHSRMSLLVDPLIRHATSSNSVDFKQLRKKKLSIYIQISDADKQRLKSILTLFWSQLVGVLSEHEPAEDEPYKVLAVLDEFGNMARIDKLKDGVTFLRSYGVIPMVMVQQLAQIYSVYGRHDAKSFLNMKYKLCFALNDLDDAKYFSELLGNKTIRVKSHSVTGGGRYSHSEQQSCRAVPLSSVNEIVRLNSRRLFLSVESDYPVMLSKH